MINLDIKVILAEDEKNARDSLHRILSKLFTHIHSFENGFEAYEYFEKFGADILITDICMPKMNGFELIEAAKKLNHNLNVIVITAFNDNYNLTTALELQVDKLLSKPISIDKLFDAIETIKEILTIKQELEYEKVKLEKFKNAIEKVDLIIALDNNFNIKYLNSMAQEKLHITKDTNILEVFDETLIDKMKDNANKMESFHTIVHLNDKDLILSLSSFASDFIIQNGENKINEISILCRDITDTIKQKEEIIKALYTDSLTKLPNRVSLLNKLENNHENYSLIIVDIKSFSEINSFYGLKTGEIIIQEVSKNMRKFLNTISFNTELFKLEADKFAILIKTVIDINQFSQTLQNRIEEHEYTINKDNKIHILVTLGANNEKVIDLLPEAVLALEYAKTNNLRNVSYIDYKGEILKYKNNLKMQTILKKALVSDKIIPFFQPIVDSDQTIVKYEALVRIVDKDIIYFPCDFLDVAKKSTMYNHITKTMIQKVFEIFHTNDYQVSINLSLLDIINPEILAFIKLMFETYCSMKYRVTFELLESESFNDIEKTNQVCNYLKSLGAEIAIDDFGSGYSNFSYFADMNIDIIKIDASLTKKATTKNGKIIIENIINMAKQLNCKVIIEYVESEELFEHLKKLNIDMFQGYYFDKPKKWSDI